MAISVTRYDISYCSLACGPVLDWQSMTNVTNSILQGDCIAQMQNLDAESLDLVFADPPFNIGYDYDQYQDNKEDQEYLDWSTRWMREVHRLLKPAGTFWLAIGDEYAAELKIAAQQIGFTTRSWVIWYYTFGVNCKNKFNRSHAHLFHFVKNEKDFTFNALDPAIRVPSARALVYNDKRANPLGRLPDDTWILRPQDVGDGFQPGDDTWFFARVAGTFKERQGFHGCQMPEQLLGRIIRASSHEGDTVFDPFVGSGTTLTVAKKLGRKWLGCELSTDYVEAAQARLDKADRGDLLDGPADPVASAPTTARGKKRQDLEIVQEHAVPQATPGDNATPLFSAPDDAPPSAVADKPVQTLLFDAGVKADAPSPRSDSPANGTLLVEPTTKEDEPHTQLPTREPQQKSSLPDQLRQLVDEAICRAIECLEKEPLLISPQAKEAIKGRPLTHDRFLVSPQIQAAFHDSCRSLGLLGQPSEWNAQLLELVAAKRLPGMLRRDPRRLTPAMLDACGHAAEIALASLRRKSPQLRLEQVFADPAKGKIFDRKAAKFGPAPAIADCRRAALRLQRKLNKLASEATKYHYVLKTRDFHRFQRFDKISLKRWEGIPGLYLLRDEQRQPLYVGSTLDLASRLRRHAEAHGSCWHIEHVSVLPQSELPSGEYQEIQQYELACRYAAIWNVVKQ